MNLHDLILDLTKYLHLTPEQQFLVTAKIKRYVHHEKANLYARYSLYAENNSWLQEILQEASESHEKWALKTDKDIVTWSVGTHLYKQKPKE